MKVSSLTLCGTTFSGKSQIESATRHCGVSNNGWFVTVMSIRLAMFALIATVATAGLPRNAFSQSNPNLDNGIKAFGSYDAASIDSIDLATGALSVNIPILAYPQRGTLPPIKVEIHHASKAFNIMGHCVPNNGEPYCEPSWTTSMPFSQPFGATLLVDDGSVGAAPTTLTQGAQGNRYSYAVHTIDGASHPLFPSPFSTGVEMSGDGTGYTCQSGCNFSDESAPFLVYTRDGVGLGASGTEDPSGNFLSFDNNTLILKDSLGRQINTSAAATSDISGCAGDFPTTAAAIQVFPGYNTVNAQIKLCYTSLSLKTAFNNKTYEDQYGYSSPWKSGSIVGETGGTQTVLQTVLLYNGSSWTTSPAWIFHYNNGANGTNTVNYGDLTGITLPTGGTIKYSYATHSYCDLGYPGFVNMSRSVIGRTENANDGSPAVVTTYSGGTVNDGTNDTVHTFTEYGDACQMYETEVQYYSGSGSTRTLLKTVDTGYTYSYDPYNNYSSDGAERVIGVMPIRTTTTLPTGLVSKVEQDYQSATINSYTISTGKTVQKREYDWGSGSPGALVRCTATTYESQQNSSYMAANLLDLPESVSVYSGACGTGTLMSSATYYYDESSLASSGITVQRDSGAGSRTVRGNLTSVHRWLNTASSNVIDRSTYYDTGEKYQQVDANSNPATTFYYDTAYAGAYLTKTTSPSTGTVAHTVSAAYDFNTGLMTSFTDQNNNTSTYSYDSLLRPTNASFPDQGCTQLSYPSFTSVQKIVCMTSSTNSSPFTANFDGLGRKVNTTQSEGSTNIYTRIAYDAQGRKAQVWNPSRCDQRTQTSCPGETTWGSTQFQYDGLSRQTLLIPPGGTATADNEATTYIGNIVALTDEVGNQWSRTSDALGRLTKVLEPNGTSTAPSMETDYAYDALDNLSSVTQWGGASGSAGARLRSFSYDSLSRLTTSTNPETGTVCYGLWSGSTCGNGYDANGNLVAKTDARGVTIAYGYDVLNRLLTKTYSSGTLTSCYSYDSATKGIGRLASDWTQAGSCPTSGGAPASVQAVTSFLVYDPMGRPKNQTTVAPNTSSTTAATYDLAGNQLTVTYPDGRMIQNSFDTVSRMSAVQYASWNGSTTNLPQTYFSETNGYDPDVHVANATFGNGVPYSAGYDNRERVQKLSYGTTSAPLWSKQYNWTANSNLQDYIDQITGVERQFGYDNLNRLTAAQDIYSTITGTGGSNSGGGSSTGGGGAVGTDPGVTGEVPWWTNPDESNLLGDINATNSGWTVAGGSLATDAFAGPDGTKTAAKVTGSSSDAYVTGAVNSSYDYTGETMAGSVWLRSGTGTMSVNLYIVEPLLAGGYTAIGTKQVQLTTSWQQFQVLGVVQNGPAGLSWQIGGGGSVGSGQSFYVWNPMLEDKGVAGTSVTNYAPDSQRLSTWGNSGQGTVTVTDNATLAPDGTNTAAVLTANAGTNNYVIDTIANPAPFSGMPVTGSVWLKLDSNNKGSTTTVLFKFWEVGSTGGADLGAQTVQLTSTWQRFTITQTAESALSTLLLQVGGEKVGGSNTFPSGMVIDAWGAQAELASVAGPYIATDASPVTMPTTLTNLLPYSQQLDGASWGMTSGTTISVNADSAPDGTRTAAMVTVPASGGYVYDNVFNPALYDLQVATVSLYLRSGTGTNAATQLSFCLVQQGNNGYDTVLNKTVALSSTWQRFQVTGTGPLDNGLTALTLHIGCGGQPASVQTFEVWGVQLELNSKAGPYVVTNDLPVITGSELVNILPNSQQLSSGSWYKNSATVATTGDAAPDGKTNTAALVTGTATGGYIADVTANPSLYDGETVTASVYLRANGTVPPLGIGIYLTETGDNGYSANINQVAKLTSSWQRFEITGTLDNGLTALSLQLGAGTGANAQITSGTTFEVWGPQLVIGSAAGPETPSAGGNVTNIATNQAAALVPYGLNEIYTYDSFGNLGQNASFNSGFTANNQMVGYAYDAAGNLLSDGYNVMTWDAENRIATAAGATYIYDAEGNRVEKQGDSVTDTIYFGGRPIARLTAGQWTDLIYGPNGLIAEVPGTQTGSPMYRMTDHLGNVVGNLTANGSYTNPLDYMPFGQVFSGNTIDPYMFTGKERDTESGLDYFGARYYASNMGRFMSPDDPFVGQDFSDPQSLNLYSYVENNPLSNTDPDGHDCVTQTRTSDTTESVSVSSGSCSGNVGDGQRQTYVPGTVTGISVNGSNSLDIGYNSYDGASSGVTNAASAPTPDRPGLAYGYGNNAAGYNQLAAASRVVSAVAGVEMSIMAPWAGAAVNCMSGGSAGSCAANMALSILPEVAELKAGATLLKDAAVLGKKGAEILQKAGGAAEATKEFEALKGTEQVLGTTRVKTLSDGSRAVLYNSTGGSGAATIAIQQAGGGVTKIRY